jgi:transcriptional regulator with XRE-family HTH domain
MFHDSILQPSSVFCQQPISVFTRCNINDMEIDEKIEFAARMNQVADLLGIPPKGKNRQKLLGKKFGVSQESARRWLSGEAYPKTGQAIEIAKRATVSFEWLMTGRGSIFDEAGFSDTAPEAKILQVMRGMDEVTKRKLITITETLAEPESTQKPEPVKRLGDQRKQRENHMNVDRRKIPYIYKDDEK